MKTWTNPNVEELEVKMTARGFTDQGEEWDFWHPANGDNPWTDENPETPVDPEKPQDPDSEYTPS